MSRPIRKALKTVLFGDTLLPQEFTIGLPEPQDEVAVWLRGAGAPLDVTFRFMTACAAPLLLGVAVDQNFSPDLKTTRGLSLVYENVQKHKILGTIALEATKSLRAGELELILFRARGCTNYCLPRLRLWAHYLLQFSQRASASLSDMKMSQQEQRAALVSFIRPHPLALVSVNGAKGGNIFPMNLMGDLGRGYFAFGLKTSRLAGQLVERSGRLAISSLPLPHSWLAYQLAINHKKESIDWSQLPFAVRPSKLFQIPIPVFAPRVREMELDTVFELGSHRLFIARSVSDESYSDCLRVNAVHGFYQYWRMQGQKAKLKESILEDAVNKRAPCPEICA